MAKINIPKSECRIYSCLKSDFVTSEASFIFTKINELLPRTSSISSTITNTYQTTPEISTLNTCSSTTTGKCALYLAFY